LGDTASDLLATPLHRLYAVLKNRRLRLPPEAAAAWQAHGATDEYLTFSQAQRIYRSTLPGAQVQRRLFWRYKDLARKMFWFDK